MDLDINKLGIIGGSGLDNPKIISNAEDVEIVTRYGAPSSLLKCGTIHNKEVVLVSRHGRDHSITPHSVNNAANIQSLIDMGCDAIITTTAVGSLREKIKRGDLVIVDQFIDFTKHRKTTVLNDFEKNPHTPMADPFDAHLRNLLINSCSESGLDYHSSGTVVTIEGPRFSTRAESLMFRSFGADIINMTTSPECIIANELEIPFAAVAMSTDYDCWKEDEDPVSWDDILLTFERNSKNVINMLQCFIKHL